MGNKLSECTPGPHEVDYDRRHDGSHHVVEKGNGHAICFMATGRDTDAALANAELLALAYDHALLLAGLCSRKVLSIIRRPNNKIAILFDDFDESVSHQDCDLTPFGTPAITPELRAALQQALGVTP